VRKDDGMTTSYAPGTPSWVDLGTTDVPAATAFYGALFGWTVDDLGPDAGGYGLIRKDGKQVAGIGPATDPARGTSWSVYFATDNADDVAAKVAAAGGTVIVAPMDVMDQGRMAVFQDPAGAFFSVWQSGQHTGAELVNETGSVCWTELMSTDIAAAKSFYETALGLTTRDVQASETMTYTLLEVGGRSVAGAMGMGPEHGPMPSSWSVYFAVDDCDATADQAIKLGGSEMMRDDSPAGRFAFLVDPQGGKFCIIKPDPNFSM
jgi:predicted enzyme related to lactoylglutathione lyase